MQDFSSPKKAVKADSVRDMGSSAKKPQDEVLWAFRNKASNTSVDKVKVKCLNTFNEERDAWKKKVNNTIKEVMQREKL